MMLSRELCWDRLVTGYARTDPDMFSSTSVECLTSVLRSRTLVSPQHCFIMRSASPCIAPKISSEFDLSTSLARNTYGGKSIHVTGKLAVLHAWFVVLWIGLKDVASTKMNNITVDDMMSQSLYPTIYNKSLYSYSYSNFTSRSYSMLTQLIALYNKWTFTHMQTSTT